MRDGRCLSAVREPSPNVAVGSEMKRASIDSIGSIYLDLFDPFAKILMWSPPARRHSADCHAMPRERLTRGSLPRALVALPALTRRRLAPPSEAGRGRRAGRP